MQNFTQLGTTLVLQKLSDLQMPKNFLFRIERSSSSRLVLWLNGTAPLPSHQAVKILDLLRELLKDWRQDMHP